MPLLSRWSFAQKCWSSSELQVKISHDARIRLVAGKHSRRQADFFIHSFHSKSGIAQSRAMTPHFMEPLPNAFLIRIPEHPL